MIEDTPAGKVKVLYQGMMIERNKGIGIVISGHMKGWLVAKHVEGQWVTIANLKDVLNELVAEGVCDVFVGLKEDQPHEREKK